MLLRVIEPFPGLVLLGVSDLMRSEAEQEAQELLERYVELARRVAEHSPEIVIRQGDAAKEIFELIAADEDIAVLVLAAGASGQGPGPLVDQI